MSLVIEEQETTLEVGSPTYLTVVADEETTVLEIETSALTITEREITFLSPDEITFSSPLTRTGDVVSMPAATAVVSGHLTAADWSTFNSKSSFSGSFAALTGKPTTIAGYGITDFNALGDARWQPLDTDLTIWASLTPSANAQSLVTAVNYGAMRILLGVVPGTDVQAFDAELTAFADLVSAADRLPYFTGSGTASLATFTLFGRSLVDDADAATARGTLGLVIGTNVQAYDVDLDTWASLSPSANAQSLVTAANYAAMRTLLGLVIGTNVQAYDADLTTWAGLTPSANAQSLVTAADYSAMRTLLGLVIGTNVQAYDADLTTWAGLTPSANAQSLVTAADYSAMRTLLGLVIGSNVQAYDADLTTWAAITPGTGVGTALAINVGSAGAFVTHGGALGTPSSGVATNLTGTAAGLTAGNVTTNANLTGHVTSTGNAAVLGSFTFAQLNTAVSDADVARTDAANSFTGLQTMLGNVQVGTISSSGGATPLSLSLGGTYNNTTNGDGSKAKFKFYDDGVNFDGVGLESVGAGFTQIAYTSHSGVDHAWYVNSVEKMRLTSAGRFILATSVTPASAAATGVAGTIAWDTGFLYVCTATNTWKRAALSTW